jgi:DNA-binding LytR/AlgR family response regulator
MQYKEQLSILIVDDEAVIAMTIENMLNKLGYKNITIVNKELKAIKHLESKHYDLAILDINLKHGEEGIGLAKLCLSKYIHFFFLSSYSDKATLDRAIETTPGAYIIKPFTEGSLYTAIEITLNQRLESDNQPIVFKDKGHFIKLSQSDILYIKSDNIYVEIFTKDKVYVYRSSILKFLAQFSANQLVKVHRSYAVNIKHISKITSTEILIGEVKIPLTRTYKNELMDRYENI